MSLKEDIIKLRSEGKSFAEIQEQLGCSKGTISYHLKMAEQRVIAKKEGAKPMVNNLHEKALTYIENYKLKRPCISCSQYLHSSQLDPEDGTVIEDLLKTIVDAETLEESKHKISQLKFICANCDRLRKFKAAQ